MGDGWMASVLDTTHSCLGLGYSLTHLDWNSKGDKLVVNSSGHELKYLSLNQRKDVASISCTEE